MYDSPTYVSMAGKSSEFTTLQVRTFCEKLSGFIYGSYGTPTIVRQVLNEMRLPEPNIINTSMCINAQEILFLSAIEDLRRDGLVDKVLCPEDIHAADKFRESLLKQIYEFRTMKMTMREMIFYRRDIDPLIGFTVIAKLLCLT